MQNVIRHTKNSYEKIDEITQMYQKYMILKKRMYSKFDGMETVMVDENVVGYR